MKRVFVLRFAKGIVGDPLYFSPYEGQLAFCPEFGKAFGVATRKEAEDLLCDILDQIKKVKPEIYNLMADPMKGMSIEEHDLGETFQ